MSRKNSETGKKNITFVGRMISLGFVLNEFHCIYLHTLGNPEELI